MINKVPVPSCPILLLPKHNKSPVLIKNRWKKKKKKKRKKKTIFFQNVRACRTTTHSLDIIVRH